ncbi:MULTISPECIES: DUF397 domain-containing protein [Actinoalloteichus]|uniref:DUF397 family protein n=1 Tax=Actinoalloteichus fjordicus TaxID=1612552 RepID=A0AAC9PS68_9PSEU|nr:MULTISPECIES: DUF397 domain-containing protein [Actinoalloteichus]APU14677.1 putative DUF397 family protein [Actinoalloteichus fjordicus]APU20645.1 putative DUF397 family protein [Actinoalloteichus sp. GBA129-24]
MAHHAPGVRRSAHSPLGSPQVEIAQAPGLTCIRDAKHRQGGTLQVSRQAFLAFVQAVKEDRLRRD